MLISCGLATGTYIITRTSSYLFTRPENNGEFMGCARDFFANISEQTRKCIGERNWEISSHMFWDNLWISVFAVSLLLSPLGTIPLSIEVVGNSLVFGLGVCTITWMIRFGLDKCLSSCPATSKIGKWIAPKGLDF